MFELPHFITIDLGNAVSTHHGCSFFRDVKTSPGPATGSTTREINMIDCSDPFNKSVEV